MKLYEELVAKQHPAVTWEIANIQTALSSISRALTVRSHGNDYLVSGAIEEGMFPGLPWRTGCVEYGYYNTPTPTGWFYASGIELETFVKGYK